MSDTRRSGWDEGVTRRSFDPPRSARGGSKRRPDQRIVVRGRSRVYVSAEPARRRRTAVPEFDDPVPLVLAHRRNSGGTYSKVGPAVRPPSSGISIRLCAWALSAYMVPIATASVFGLPLNA